MLLSVFILILSLSFPSIASPPSPTVAGASEIQTQKIDHFPVIQISRSEIVNDELRLNYEASLFCKVGYALVTPLKKSPAFTEQFPLSNQIIKRYALATQGFFSSKKRQYKRDPKAIYMASSPASNIQLSSTKTATGSYFKCAQSKDLSTFQVSYPIDIKFKQQPIDQLTISYPLQRNFVISYAIGIQLQNHREILFFDNLKDLPQNPEWQRVVKLLDNYQQKTMLNDGLFSQSWKVSDFDLIVDSPICLREEQKSSFLMFENPPQSNDEKHRALLNASSLLGKSFHRLKPHKELLTSSTPIGCQSKQITRAGVKHTATVTRLDRYFKRLYKRQICQKRHQANAHPTTFNAVHTAEAGQLCGQQIEQAIIASHQQESADYLKELLAQAQQIETPKSRLLLLRSLERNQSLLTTKQRKRLTKKALRYLESSIKDNPTSGLASLTVAIRLLDEQPKLRKSWQKKITTMSTKLIKQNHDVRYVAKWLHQHQSFFSSKTNKRHIKYLQKQSIASLLQLKKPGNIDRLARTLHKDHKHIFDNDWQKSLQKKRTRRLEKQKKRERRKKIYSKDSTAPINACMENLTGYFLCPDAPHWLCKDQCGQHRLCKCCYYSPSAREKECAQH